MTILGRDGHPLNPVQPPPNSLTVGVDHDKEILVLTTSGIIATPKGPVMVQLPVVFPFVQARQFADAFRAAMIPPPLNGKTKAPPVMQQLEDLTGPDRPALDGPGEVAKDSDEVDDG